MISKAQVHKQILKTYIKNDKFVRIFVVLLNSRINTLENLKKFVLTKNLKNHDIFSVVNVSLLLIVKENL